MADKSQFLETIAAMHNGDVVADLDRKLDQAVTALRETGGVGKSVMTIKLTITAAQRAQRGGGVELQKVMIDIDSTIKKPELPIGGSMFFLTPDGGFTRDDPRQAELFDERRERMAENG